MKMNSQGISESRIASSHKHGFGSRIHLNFANDINANCKMNIILNLKTYIHKRVDGDGGQCDNGQISKHL